MFGAIKRGPGSGKVGLIKDERRVEEKLLS